MEGKIEVEYSDIERGVWDGQPPFRSTLPAHRWHWRAWVIMEDGRVWASAGHSRYRYFAIRRAKKAAKRHIRTERFHTAIKQRSVSTTFKI